LANIFDGRRRVELGRGLDVGMAEQLLPGRDRRVMAELSLRNVCAWSPLIERFIDRKSGRSVARPHLGRRVISPFLPGLIFVPDFELDHPALCDRTIGDLGDLLRVGECVASLKVEHMAALRKIVNVVNGRRFGRGSRGLVKFKPGDKVYIADGPFRDFAAEVQSLDSRGRLKVFIAALMRGVSATLSETQVEPA